MIEDKYFSFIRICPETKQKIADYQHSYSNGVCPSCGDVDNSTFTHAIQISGKWHRPTLFERLKGNKSKFVEKENKNGSSN